MRITYRILAILVALSSGSVCAVERAQDTTVMLAPVDGPEIGRALVEPSLARKTIVRKARPPVKKTGDTQTYAEPGTVGNMSLPPSAESEARAALSAVPSAQVQANQLNQAQANQGRATSSTATQVSSQAQAANSAAKTEANPAANPAAKQEAKAEAAADPNAQSEPPPLDVTPSTVRKIRIRKRTEPAPAPVVRAPTFAPMKDDLGPSEPMDAPAREAATEAPKAASVSERAAEDNSDQAVEAKSTADNAAAATASAPTQPAAVEAASKNQQATDTQASSPQVTGAQATQAEAVNAEASKAESNDANASSAKEAPTTAASTPNAAKFQAEAAQPVPEALTQNASKSEPATASMAAADLAPSARSNECDPPLQAEVMALFDRWSAALRSGDLKQVLANYAPNALLLPTGSSRAHFTQADKADYFAPLLKRRPEASIDDRYIDVDCNSATDAGLYTFRFSDGSQVKARYSFSYKRIDGQWLISSHHSSAMPNSAAVTAPVTTSINGTGVDKPFSDKLVGDKPPVDKSLVAKPLADKQAKPVAALKHTVDSGPTQGWVRFP